MHLLEKDKSVCADITARLSTNAALDHITQLSGIAVGTTLLGKPEERFAYEVHLRVKSRTGLAALMEIPGIKALRATLDVPLKLRKTDRWGRTWWIYLRGLEEALRAETELQGLLIRGKISHENFEQASWMLHRLLRLLRRP